MYELNVNGTIIKYKLLDINFMINFNKKYLLEKDKDKLDIFKQLLVVENYVDETANFLSNIEYDFLILHLLANSDDNVIQAEFECPYCKTSNVLDIDLEDIMKSIKEKYFIPTETVHLEHLGENYSIHLNYKNIKRNGDINDLIDTLETSNGIVVLPEEIKQQVLKFPIKLGKKLIGKYKPYILYQNNFMCTNIKCDKSSTAYFEDIGFFLMTLLSQELH